MNFAAEEQGVFLVVYPEQDRLQPTRRSAGIGSRPSDQKRGRGRAGHHRRHHARKIMSELQNRSATRLRRGAVRRAVPRRPSSGKLIRIYTRRSGFIPAWLAASLATCLRRSRPCKGGILFRTIAGRTGLSGSDDRLPWRSGFDRPSAQWRRGHRTG